MSNEKRINVGKMSLSKMKKVYIKDFEDMHGPAFIRLFIYHYADLEEARKVDLNYDEQDYVDEIDNSGFFFHDIEIKNV